MTVEILLQIAGIFGGCATVYAAIRSDLARAIATAEQASASADKAHSRIDGILQTHHQ